MKPTEKRDVVVKQIIKPLLKKNGFTISGLDWHREVSDSYIIIHMFNSQFNSIVTGARFRFHISMSKKEEITKGLSKQWIYNQVCDLNQFDFLPYCGLLSPYYSGDMYQIDGYKNNLPSDTPVEQICSQIGEDFEKYILPDLNKIKSYENFSELRAQKKGHYEDKEVRLLRFYYMLQMSASELSGKGFQTAARMREKYKLTSDDLLSHLEWLDVCRNNSAFPQIDLKDWVRSFAEQL